jgi:hypothetical protein
VAIRWENITGGGGNAGATPGSVTCAGTITFKFKWNGGPTGEPAPPRVVVKEVCTATAEGTGALSVNSGLGGGIVAQGTLLTQTGVRYSIVNVTNGSRTFTVTVSPSASASSSTGFAPSATVSYSVSLVGVEILPFGTTTTGIGASKKHYWLVGSRGSAAVYAGLYSVANQVWTRGPLDTLDHVVYGPGNPPKWRETYEAQDPTYFGVVAPSWVYEEPGKDEVSCAFELWDNGVFVGFVNLPPKELYVTAFSFEWFATYMSTNRSVWNSSNIDPIGIGLGTASFQVGSADFGMSTSFKFPSFDAPFGHCGSFMWHQVAKLSRKTDGVVRTSFGPPLFLDTSWPYAGPYPVVSPTIGMTEFQDSPYFPFNWGNPVSVEIDDFFVLWALYKPPANLPWLPSEYVPIDAIEWNWKTHNTRPTTLYPWPNPANDSSSYQPHGPGYYFPGWPTYTSPNWPDVIAF